MPETCLLDLYGKGHYQQKNVLPFAFCYLSCFVRCLKQHVLYLYLYLLKLNLLHKSWNRHLDEFLVYIMLWHDWKF
jgi:hypothetical protein